MTPPHHFLYLSRADVERVACPLGDIAHAVELAFQEKARGRTIMQPKHWLAPSSRRFFSAMSSALPKIGVAGCKWQSGSPDNGALGQPYITGQYVLNALDTGLPLAVMDSTWITEVRTAAASAVAASHLSVAPPTTVAILGCGLQARRHIEALTATFPSLREVRCYDIVPAAAERFRELVSRQHDLRATVCADARGAFAGSELVITCGPIAPDSMRLARADWLEAGATAVTIDYDCYWQRGTLSLVDQVFTDDVAQLDHSRPDGYFDGVPATVQELAGVVAKTDPGRNSPTSRVVCINMGIALEDAAAAFAVYERARALGIGTELPI